MNSLMGLVTANYHGGDFGPLTAERPSASLPFGGRYRLIDFPLSNMVNSGITTVGLITPHMYRSLMDHVGVGKEWALNRKVGGLYILPGSIYGMKSETGKTLIRDLILNREFLVRGECEHVLICDSSKIYNIDFSEVEKFHEESGADVTMIYKKSLVIKNSPELYLDVSNKKVTNIAIGPNKDGNCFIDAFIINSKLLFNFLDWYADMGYVDIIDAIIEHLKELTVAAYKFNGYVGAVYDLQSYLETSQDLLRSDVREHLFADEKRPIYTKVQDAPPAKYMTGCEISASLISSGCIIEGTVENSIIFRDVHIEKGAVIRNCVLMQHCVIGRGARLEHVICDKGVKIRPEVQLSASYGAPLAVTKSEII